MKVLGVTLRATLIVAAGVVAWLQVLRPAPASPPHFVQLAPPSQPSQINLGPPAPTPVAPWSDTIVHLAAPANTNVAFKWLAGTGGPAATHYTLCVTDENLTCSQPSAALYPAPGQPPITGTTYVARLPVGFQGKRLRWSVAACGHCQLVGRRRRKCTDKTCSDRILLRVA